MKIYQVGGAVRDKILGILPKDIDYVVVGATVEKMLELGFFQVGKKFPVFINPKTKAEYALARKEIKIGDKHTDFEFVFTPDITLKEDLQRRDFTCNALAYDEKTDELFDYNSGLADIQKKIIRHVNAEHFVEDPLRVLRMCRFAAQLNFEVDDVTMELTQEMVKDKMLKNLSAERVWKEIEKALHTNHFEKFVKTAKECGALKVIFPILPSPSFELLEKAKNCSPKLKFACLVAVNNSEEEVQEICRRLKIPNEYKNFALVLCRHQYMLEEILGFSPEELVEFVDKFSKGNGLEFLNDLFLFYNMLANNAQQVEITMLATKIGHIFDLLSRIKASDMPNFDSLKNSKEINMLYKDFRINMVLKKIKK